MQLALHLSPLYRTSLKVLLRLKRSFPSLTHDRPKFKKALGAEATTRAAKTEVEVYKGGNIVLDIKRHKGFSGLSMSNSVLVCNISL